MKGWKDSEKGVAERCSGKEALLDTAMLFDTTGTGTGTGGGSGGNSGNSGNRRVIIEMAHTKRAAITHQVGCFLENEVVATGAAAARVKTKKHESSKSNTRHRRSRLLQSFSTRKKKTKATDYFSKQNFDTAK